MMISMMSLRLGRRRDIIRWAIWFILTIIFLIFLVRVISFENSYYSEKEGSERVVVVRRQDDNDEAADAQELIEVPPTETEVYEYVVSPDQPRYLSIDRLGIKNTRILTMGINDKGELDTPNNIFDVGWYIDSGKPGQGGTMVIDGHNGGPHLHGVFKDLPNLVVGDVIKIERGDGLIFRYKVVDNVSVLLGEADDYMREAFKSPEKGKESLTLITCTGEWSDQRQTYLSRQFTRALIVE